MQTGVAAMQPFLGATGTGGNILDRMSNGTQYCTRSAAALIELGRSVARTTAAELTAAVPAAAG